MMQIVVPDKRYKKGTRNYWKVLGVVDGRSIGTDLALSSRAKTHWQNTKSPLGYTNFRGLSMADVKGIISATKRKEARINVERWGRVAFYKLLK